MKILRNAYQPLPPGSFSRAFNQLLGAMLRADPDDRPTTNDLMGLSLVKKHLERLMVSEQASHSSMSTLESNWYNNRRLSDSVCS